MSNLSANKTYKRKYFSILAYSQLQTGVMEQKNVIDEDRFESGTNWKMQEMLAFQRSCRKK